MLNERQASNLKPGLRCNGLKIAYGGNVAVTDATFHAPVGQITGLIGPNGAGKTSIFNVCNGFVIPEAGTVEFLGHDITGATPARRARLGLGRTFQRMELCQALSVQENVWLGAESQLAGGNPFRQIFPRRSELERIRAATDEALKLCEITPLSNRLVGTLSTGQRRVVELARALAADFSVLLLDEPSSGLDDAETQRFARIVRSVTRLRGTGVLIVEHDMALVMELCDYIYVLDFGHLIFSGTAAEVAASEVVRAAYLGSLELVGDRMIP